MAGDPNGHSPAEHVRWRFRPQLHDTTLFVAFEGWSDAGDAASTAGRYLSDQWDADVFADLDPEIFYDFSDTRPRVQFGIDLQRELVWPENQFATCAVPGFEERSVVTLVGIEPQLRWRTFIDQVVTVARETGAELLVTFGALLAEVPHSRDTPVFATSDDDSVVARHHLAASRYEGPTGITGALHTACAQIGLPSAALWAAVPTYVPAAPSPKAALSLVREASRLTGLPVDATELEIASSSYERQVDELVGDDDETREYVEHLESRFDRGAADPFSDEDSLVDEVERYLRDQPE